MWSRTIAYPAGLTDSAEKRRRHGPVRIRAGVASGVGQGPAAFAGVDMPKESGRRNGNAAPLPRLTAESVFPPDGLSVTRRTHAPQNHTHLKSKAFANTWHFPRCQSMLTRSVRCSQGNDPAFANFFDPVRRAVIRRGEPIASYRSRGATETYGMDLLQNYLGCCDLWQVYDASSRSFRR